jgi:hypothetical protein
MVNSGKIRPISGPARFLLAAAAIAVVGFVSGIGVGLLSGETGPGAIAATAGLVAVTMAAALLGGLWWWSRLDEAAREAHKWAWWWGGTAGMAFGAVLLGTLMAHGQVAVISDWAGEGPVVLFGAGGAAILTFQLAGYTIAWAVWWLRRR